jgi:hypothetical protein
MGLSAHQSAASASCDWLTPPEWIDALGGPFDLDPCASVRQPWPTAAEQWTEGGLDKQWRGFVWLNPPYGGYAVIAPWLRRMADHNNGIACIPARTETRAWHEFVWPQALLILFARGRPTFRKPITGEPGKWNSGAPIALVAYGVDARMILNNTSIQGARVKPLQCHHPRCWKLYSPDGDGVCNCGSQSQEVKP